ncbi:hypothetical protein EUX98_g198 [Antrodiella citrinella]|uniref:Uncharacterized protein n=1 Tax=Antrodiella citrinella TaxID=2447956 RepID=A0A4V3XJP5_9APHY|nr:hypothetical protein EUX98_g198 [Antrodiella citrinella]
MRRTYAPPSLPDNRSRVVNNLLHTLRGEHFRHARNQSNRNFVAKRIEYSGPNRTLPIEQIFGEDVPSDGDEWYNPSSSFKPKLASSIEDSDRPEWRKRALALLFSQAPLRPTDESISPADDSNARTGLREIPLLAELCLRVILPYCQGASFAEDLVPYLPPHLRRLLLRWSAVHAPLNRSNLYALCEPELGGHADGDLVVVGPYASLPTNYFKRVEAEAADATAQVAESSSTLHIQQEAITVSEDDAMEEDSGGSWDSDSSKEDETPPLTLLALVSTPLSTPTLFTLPPSLTHLALLSLPTLTPIHRLPRLLPLLEVLDLSYNLWIGQPKIFGNTGEGGETLLERTEWSRWSRLRVLGLRECGVSRKIAARVNQGRWVDVEVIGIIDQG